MKRRLGSLGRVILALGLIAAMIAFGLVVRARARAQNTQLMGGMEMEMGPGMEMAPMSALAPVTTEIAQPGSIAAKVTYTGSVVPYLQQNIYPRVEGWLTDLTVYAGSPIRQGQVLARQVAPERYSEVSGAQFERSVAAAEEAASGAAVRAAEARQRQAEQTVAANEQVLFQARQGTVKAQADRDYWQAEIAREESLLKTGAISREEYDRERAQYLSARAGLGQANAQVKQAEADLEAAKHGLVAAQSEAEVSAAERRASAGRRGQAAARLRTAQTFADYTTIRSPVDGVVLERLIDPGVLVSPGMAILRVAKLDRVRLQANVAERDLRGIRVGTPVIAHFPLAKADAASYRRQWGTAASPSMPDREITLRAQVTYVFPVQDPVSRTAVVEAVVPNPSQFFLPGQYLVLDLLPEEHHDVLTVPRRAVIQQNGRPAVWVVVNDKATMRLVDTGITDGERVEITQGLRAGDEVIYMGQQGLREGQPVKRVPWGAPPSAATEMPGMEPGPQKAPQPDMKGMPGMENMPGMDHSGHGG